MIVHRSRAPLRLGLAGGGTDISPFCDIYGGAILNATIDMHAYCSIIPNSYSEVVFEAEDFNKYQRFESLSSLPLDGFFKLHIGVYNAIVKRYNNGEPLSFRMVTYSDVPAGSGLGSSSTMVVAMIKAYQQWLNLPLGEYDIARLAFDIERREVGLSGGKQDQYSATFGGFNYMEFYADDRVIVNPLRVKQQIISELEVSTLLYFTGLSRASAVIIDDQAKLLSEEKKSSFDAMFQLKEEAREVKEALLTGDFKNYVNGIRRGWEAKKATSSSVSNVEIETAFEVATKAGALTGKVSGAGGGGFIMFVVEPSRRYEVTRELARLGGSIRSFHFCATGGESWTSKSLVHSLT